MFKLLAASGIALASAAEWSIEGDNVASMTMGCGAASASKHLCAAGDNQNGAIVLVNTDLEGNYTLAETDPTLMFLSIGTNHQSGASVVAGIFGTQFGDAESGFVKSNSGQGSTQNVEAFGDKSFGMAGMFKGKNGVAVSTDNGDNFQAFALPEGAYTARYGSYPSDSTWYVTGGAWPVDNDVQGYPLSQFVEKDAGKTFLRFGGASGDDEGWEAGVYRTQDGGATWDTLLDETTDWYPNAIHCSSESKCAFVTDCDSGASVYTIDGDTVTKVFTDTDAGSSLIAVRMVSDTEIWAAGGVMDSYKDMEARFWHSTDGGATWAKDGAIPYQYAMGMDMFDAEHGVAATITAQQTGAICHFQ